MTRVATAALVTTDRFALGCSVAAIAHAQPYGPPLAAGGEDVWLWVPFEPEPDDGSVRRTIGCAVLTASAAGFPLTEFVIRRGGTKGAVLAEGVCLGLAVRDMAMIAEGVPSRLRRVPAFLLCLELGAAVLAAAATVPLLRKKQSDTGGRTRVELLRQVATASLFGLHTIRFGIFMTADQGRRSTNVPIAQAQVESAGNQAEGIPHPAGGLG